MKKYFNLTFWLITISVFIFILVPKLIQDGMFMDGVLYASVSKNLGNDFGTFWYPRFSELGFAGHTTFHEHPPFGIWLESVFFRFLGNSIYVERFYSLVAAVISAWIIAFIWSLIAKKDEEMKKLGWLPILFWISIPLTSWSFQNNVLENTMGIFTLSAVYFSLKGIYAEKNSYGYIIISGIFIFLASFSKGVPGLFPLITIGAYWIIGGQIRFIKVFLFSLILILVPVSIYALILTDTDAFNSLSIHFNERLLGRIESAPTADSRIDMIHYIVGELQNHTLAALILLVIFATTSIIKKFDKLHFQKIMFFIIIGLSGSLPLMLTLVQKKFYFSHSLPFFAIGLALIVAPGFKYLIKKINPDHYLFKIVSIVALVLVISSIGYSAMQKGKIKTEADILHDVYLMGKIIPAHSTINIDASMWNDWSLQCYLVRHYNISLYPYKKKYYDYLLLDKTLEHVPFSIYKKMKLNTERYDLYTLKPGN